jgi:hypothetical protein
MPATCSRAQHNTGHTHTISATLLVADHVSHSVKSVNNSLPTHHCGALSGLHANLSHCYTPTVASASLLNAGDCGPVQLCVQQA